MLLGLGIGLSFFGIGFLCWMLFSVAIYALPCAAGFWAFLATYHSGAGPIGAIAIGVIAGAATFAAGQFALANSHNPLTRALIALVFTVPAAIAGYSVAAGLAGIGISSHAWDVTFGILGGFMASCTAWVRLAGTPPLAGQGIGGSPGQLPTATAIQPPAPSGPSRRAF